MAFWNKFKNRIRYEVQKHLGAEPIMVTGYRRLDGTILKNTRISNTTHIGKQGQFDVEDHVYIGHFNTIDTSGGVAIGEGCQITNYVSILCHSSHNSIRYYGQSYYGTRNPKGMLKGPISLGAYTFVGPHSVIMPGTQIGKGSIVAAYSYVQGDFPPFSVIKGNPAVVVGDVRATDEAFLQAHPELRSHYDQWAKKA